MGDKIVRLQRTRLTPELSARVIELARAGRSLRAIAGELRISVAAFTRWQRQDADFRAALALARRDAIIDGRRTGRGPGVGTPQTDDKAGAILRALESGMSRTHAAARAGISPSTFDAWLTDPDFEREVLAAESACQERALAVIRDAAQDQWQAAGWLLERRFPADFARRFEMPYAERVRVAAKIGADLADLLVRGLGDAGLDAARP